jgi:hypothetical protein
MNHNRVLMVYEQSKKKLLPHNITKIWEYISHHIPTKKIPVKTFLSPKNIVKLLSSTIK